MKVKRKKSFGLVFCVILLLSAYVHVVQLVNAVGSVDFVDSFALNGENEAGSSNVFQIGDTLTVVAESQLANAYTLVIKENSSVIFVKNGEFNEAKMKTRIVICPPVFSAGHTYVAVFHAYAWNKPLPGFYFENSATSVFTVVSVETKLGLGVEYNGDYRCLYLNTNLTTVEGSPVANETIYFHFQFDKGRRCEGWVGLVSVRTDSDGLVNKSVGFALDDGNYRVRARFIGNEDYGKSENITGIAVSKTPVESLFLGESSEFGTDGFLLNIGSVSLEVSNSSPYALLPLGVTAEYTSNVTLEGFFGMVFFMDHANFSGYLTVANMAHGGGPPFVYDASVVLIPNVTGSHKIIAGVASGENITVIQRAMHGEGLVASGEVDIDIQKCPCNIALDIPDVVYDDNIPIVVALSKPRPYEAEVNNFSVTTTLAPQFVYDGEDFVTNEGVEAVALKLYVNSIPVDLVTDASGLAYYGFADFEEFDANLTAVVDAFSVFSARVERFISFRKIRVYDNVNASDDLFKFYFTAGNVVDGEGLYVGVENRLEVKASLMNQSVYNLPVSILYGRLVSSGKTNASGIAIVPSGSNYARIGGANALHHDQNSDMTIDLLDLVAVAGKFGNCSSDPGWNVDCDLNHDNVVDLLDLVREARRFGDQADRVEFNGGQRSYFDSQGFARIPDNTTWLEFYENEMKAADVSVEFFHIVSEKSTWTNNLGRLVDSWVPSDHGIYLVHVNSSFKFDLSSSSDGSITGLDAPANLVEYFEVLKRPIQVTISHDPDPPVYCEWGDKMIATCYDSCLGQPVEGLTVNFYLHPYLPPDFYPLGPNSGPTDSSGMADLTWGPANLTYLDLNDDSWDFVFYVECVETNLTQGAVVEFVEVDFRDATSLEFLGNETVNVDVQNTYDFTFNLTVTGNLTGPPRPLWGSHVEVYINDVLNATLWTNSSGLVTLEDWMPPQQNELYFFRVCFAPQWHEHDWFYFKPSEARFVAVEGDLVPLSILFDVTPKDFSPGTQITLSANVSNTATGEPVPNGCPVRFYKVYPDQSSASIGLGYTDSGLAELPWTYQPSEPVLAFIAEIEAPTPTQKVITSPVMLNVGDATRLLLWIDRSESSTVHTIRGKLKSGEIGVLHEIVEIKVNETEYTLETDLNGNFSKTVNMPPRSSGSIMYTVTASFEGTNPCNNSAYDYTPNGTRYAVCTTIKYGYKPVSNSTWLIVNPDGTTQTQSTKTQEEMQAEAMQDGTLSIWPEFSWWYPWFRMHIQINVNPRIHVAFSPILPGGEDADWNGLDSFSDLNEQFFEELVIDTLGIFIGYVFAKGFSLWNWPATAIAFLVKAGLQTWFLAKDWYDSGRMLAAAIANFIIGIMAIGTSMAKAFLDTLFKIVTAGTMSALYLLYNGAITVATPIQYIRTWADWVEVGMDFAFGITALIRYLNLTGQI